MARSATHVAPTSPGGGTPPLHGQEGATLPRRQILWIFFGLMLSILVAVMDQTIVSTALPTIAGELHGLSELSWVITAYLLAQTISMPLYGKLGDLLGRKYVFQFALVLFLVGSVLSGISQNMSELIIFRAIQGLGGGGLMIGAQSIIGEITSPRERGRYMSMMMPMIGVATVVGPLLGGLFTDHLTWRWIFYINIPIGGAALALTSVVLKLPRRSLKPKIDYLGAVLLAGAVACLVLVTTWGGTEYDWGDPVILGLSCGVVALGVAWFFTERRAAEPVMPLRLFRDRIFVVCVVLGAMVGLAMFGAVSYLPTFLQIVGGASATNSGLLMLPMVAGMMTASVTTGQLMSRTGRYKVFPILGTALAAVGLYLLSTLDADSSRLVIDAYMVVLGLGIGQVMPVLTTVVQNSVRRVDLGAATSGVNFFRQIGASLGVALVGSLFTNRLHDQLLQHLPPQLADRAVANVNAITPEALRHLPAQLQHGIVAAFADALPPVFAYFVPILVAGFIVAWFLKEKPLGATAHAATPVPAAAGRSAGEGASVDGSEGVPAAINGYPAGQASPEAGVGPRQGVGASRAGVGPRQGVGASRAGAGPRRGSRSGNVLGSVHRADGAPLTGAAVTMIDFSGREIDRALSGGDGAYSLAPLASGTYMVVASAGDHQPDIATISVNGFPVQHEIVLTAKP